MAYETVKYTEPGTGTDFVVDDDGAGGKTQAVKILDGTPGSTDHIPGDSTNGMLVNLGTNNDVTVTTLPAIPAGTNNIGDVDVLSLPAIPAGDNNIGNVDVVTLPDVTVVGKAADGAAVSGNPVLIAGQDGTNVQTLKTDTSGELQVDVLSQPALTAADVVTVTGGAGQTADVKVTLDSEAVVLGAGSAAIGKLAANSGVDIGDVDVLTVPADPFGANADAASATGSISAKLRFIAATGIPVTSVPSHAVTNAGTFAVQETGTVTVQGGAANASPVSGNPNLIGGRASNAIPTDVGADGDAVSAWMNRFGALITSILPHVGLDGSPFTLTSKTVQKTGTESGTDVLTPTSGKKLVVTSVQIQAGGTTAGTVQLWFGANADTSYTRGTDLAIFDGEFAPSATLKPGIFMQGPFIASAADHEVHVTTSASINPLTITLWYYEI